MFYPLTMIKRLTVSAQDRVIYDPFEDGDTSARRTWPEHYFKRRFQLQHSPLTLLEYNKLRGFFSAHGTASSFWFRDNASRGGHACVRFASPLQTAFQVGERAPVIDLVETAAVRALVELDEITTAAGSAPVLWIDPNRELYYEHMGTVYQGASDLWTPDSDYTVRWQAGSLSLSGVDAQVQGLGFNGVNWAKTTDTMDAILEQATPPATIFLLTKHSTAAANQVVVALGTHGAASQLGFAITSGNCYTSYIGTSSDFVYGYVENNPANTWRSFAASYAGGSTTATFYCNAANSAAINDGGRSYVAGPFCVGASSGGELLANPANAMATASIAQVLLFNSTLTAAQVKALHNLLGPQYGLTQVP